MDQAPPVTPSQGLQQPQHPRTTDSGPHGLSAADPTSRQARRLGRRGRMGAATILYLANRKKHGLVNAFYGSVM